MRARKRRRTLSRSFSKSSSHKTYVRYLPSALFIHSNYLEHSKSTQPNNLYPASAFQLTREIYSPRERSMWLDKPPTHQQESLCIEHWHASRSCQVTPSSFEWELRLQESEHVSGFTFAVLLFRHIRGVLLVMTLHFRLPARGRVLVALRARIDDATFLETVDAKTKLGCTDSTSSGRLFLMTMNKRCAPVIALPFALYGAGPTVLVDFYWV